MDQETIRLYEELQNNAFPALQTVLYDGWSIRIGANFTYRVNCANPIYHEVLPVEEKLCFIENLYKSAGLDNSIIKLHTGMAADRLSACSKLLDQMRYDTQRDGNIFICDLSNFDLQARTNVQISGQMSTEWLDGFLSLNGTTEDQRSAAKRMLSNIYYPVITASIIENGTMVACGLGVMERGYVGLYDIYVDAKWRRRGLGSDICTSIMNYGKVHWCHTAYLQVLSDNLGARALYRSLGYRETYEYWFRTKKL